MQSEVCDERPDCCLVLEEREVWVLTLDDIREVEEYEEFVKQLHNNSITEESLVKYTKYHFEL